MTSRYDELSDSARWYIENFDEIDLADLCASKETSLARIRDQAEVANVRAAKAEAALARVRDLADEYPVGIDTALIEAALDQPAPGPAATEATDGPAWMRAGTRDLSIPAHDTGPTVREAAADDRAHWNAKHAGEG
jgi:hypothetical protein